MPAGRIVVLNGAPRSGKSSIVAEIQRTFDGPWMNLGVDVFVREVTPERYRPGMGLRPGDEVPELRPLVPAFYRAILADCATIVADLPVLFVGVRCPIEEIMRRRNAGQAGRAGHYAVGTADDPIPAQVERWQAAVESVGPYDLKVDTSRLDPAACAEVIRMRLCDGPPPGAFAELAG